MQIFNYDDDGIYTGSSEAREDPLESTKENPVYLFPRNSTKIAPGPSITGFAQVFNGDSWSSIEDHRGERAFRADGEEVIVNILGSLDSLGLSSNYTPPPKSADQVLSDCVCLLANKRSSKARSGVVVNGVEMQTDKESLAAMDQYATESMMNGLTVVHWEKADGTFHDWPIADFKKLFSEITKYVNACFGRQKVLLADINAAADPTTVDISTGWPSKTITFV